MQAWAALVLAAAAKRAATKTTLSARLPLLFVCLLWYKGAVTKLEFQPHSQSLAKPKKGCIVQPRVREGGTDKVLCTPSRCGQQEEEGVLQQCPRGSNKGIVGYTVRHMPRSARLLRRCSSGGEARCRQQ